MLAIAGAPLCTDPFFPGACIMPIQRWAVFLLASVITAVTACTLSHASALEGGLTSWDAKPDFPSALKFVFRPSNAIPGTQWLSIRLSDGRHTYALDSHSFRETPDDPNPHSPWYEVAPGDSVRIVVALRGESGDTLGVGEFWVSGQQDWASVALINTHRSHPRIPAPLCSACFPLRATATTTPGDMLLVNLIRQPLRGPPLPPS